MVKSDLATVVIESPNKNSPRMSEIDTVTIHCMAGDMSVESCGAMFSNPDREASSNYGIGSDGRIACYVGEEDRSWCSSNRINDNRAITIEVANDGGADTGWHVSDEAYNSLISLLVDICRRNNIDELVWSEDREDRVNHNNGCNMTVHRDFANKACPGDYLYSLHGQIADEVNELLGVDESEAEPEESEPEESEPEESEPEESEPEEETEHNTLYRVQVGSFSIESNAYNLQSKLSELGYDTIVVKAEVNFRTFYRVQVGAYAVKDNAINMQNKLTEDGFDSIIMEVIR